MGLGPPRCGAGSAFPAYKDVDVRTAVLVYLRRVSEVGKVANKLDLHHDQDCSLCIPTPLLLPDDFCSSTESQVVHQKKHHDGQPQQPSSKNRGAGLRNRHQPWGHPRPHLPIHTPTPPHWRSVEQTDTDCKAAACPLATVTHSLDWPAPCLTHPPL